MPPEWFDDLRAFWREVRQPTPQAVLTGFPSSVGFLRALLPFLPVGSTLSVYEPDTDAMRALFDAQPRSGQRRRAGEFAEVPLTPSLLDDLATLERPGFSLAQAYFVLAPAPLEKVLIASFDSDFEAFADLALSQDVLAQIAAETGATLRWPTAAGAAG